ncbi:SRPBCC family protein [Nocardia sp. NPDC056541]|uniref:SRPBCC family protein n=1 Tax=Nocardia sp. NPDC056541 TaxID=3345860 RepID=UPI00366A7C67
MRELTNSRRGAPRRTTIDPEHPMTSTTARRALSASVEVDADPLAVWDAISNLRRMRQWSPQCRIMLPLGRLKAGTRTLNINRKGRTFWPTTSTILVVEVGSRLTFRTDSNRAVWTYQLDRSPTGTVVTLRRDASSHTPRASVWLVNNVLGGIEEFDETVRGGMNETVRRIKQSIEAQARPTQLGDRT